MTIILYTNPTNEIRGKTRRYLYEIKSNVFVGRISKRVRETLWSELDKCGVQATMIYTSNNEQGFETRSINQEYTTFIDIDGVKLKTFKKKQLELQDLKAKPDIRLIDHMMDAGIFAETIMREGAMQHSVAILAERTNNTFESVVQTFAALTALHDIGKCHPRFQFSIAEHDDMLLETLELFEIKNVIIDNFRHERYSIQLLQELGIKNQYLHIIGYHHLGKEGDWNVQYPCTQQELWHELQQELLSKILNNWTLTDLSGKFYRNMCADIFWGVMVMSDWIVSGEEWKKWKTQHPVLSIREVARSFLQAQMLDNRTMQEYLQGVNFETAFGFHANDLQKAAIQIAKDYEPDFVMVEHVCGGGKSEAGMALCALAGRKMGGLHVCMPTNATVEGMISRMRRIAKRCNLPCTIPEFCGHAMLSNNPEDMVDPFFWSHRARHHASYPFSCSTIDQEFKSIGRFKYSVLALAGLSNKTLLIDEVHAYDAFMQTELEMLLKWSNAMKRTTVLLSATMPTQKKEQLLKAAGGRDFKCTTGYPMITIVKDGKVLEFPVQTSGKRIDYDLQCVDEVYAEMCKVTLNPPKGCTGLICHDVDTAQRVYKFARQHAPAGTIVLSYHSRDTLANKEKMIQTIERLFGKDRSNRPECALLISTPIIEQSLDIDMDYLWTAIAPIDLIIQRIGRWHRHDDAGTVRANSNLGTSLHILVPKNYGTLSLIYDTNILKQTQNVLSYQDHFDTVLDVRHLIDDVYNSTPTPTNEATSQIMARRCIFDAPSERTCRDADAAGIMYPQYHVTEPTTRESTYPTVDIALLTPEEAMNDMSDFEFMKWVRKNRVITVGEHKIKHFTDYNEGVDYLSNVRIFITDNGIVSCGLNTMQLTECGLVIQ